MEVKDNKLKSITVPVVNLELVKTLEDILEEVKEGEIISILFVMGYSENSVSHCWEIDKRTYGKMILGQTLEALTNFRERTK